jgi:two-component system, cell cycle sensor histidine kinase and response regulator CckA
MHTRDPVPGSHGQPRQADDGRTSDRYRLVFDRATIGMALVDPAGYAVETNPALRRMLGRDDATLRRVPLLEFARPEDAAESRRLFRELTSGARSTFRAEARFETADGATLWALLTVSALEADGETLALHTLKDITERKVAEEALVESQIQLLHAQKMEAVGRLAGGVSHDVNNMLTAIKGFATLLRMDLPREDPLHAYVQEIEKAVDRSTSLTRQLLAFSRRQVLRPRVLDLDELIREMERMLRRVIGDDVEFRSTLAAGEARIQADSGQMEQILMNLVVNARDAVRRGGRILVSTTRCELRDAEFPGEPGPVTGSFVRLSVEDTGCGMSRETCSRVFEPFFTTKPEGEGTGLGLSTVRGIVKQSGGYVSVASELGFGTTFTVYLPCVADPQARAQPGSRAGDRAHLAG